MFLLRRDLTVCLGSLSVGSGVLWTLYRFSFVNDPTAVIRVMS